MPSREPAARCYDGLQSGLYVVRGQPGPPVPGRRVRSATQRPARRRVGAPPPESPLLVPGQPEPRGLGTAPSARQARDLVIDRSAERSAQGVRPQAKVWTRTSLLPAQPTPTVRGLSQ